MKKRVSIIVPVYNEEKSLPELYERLSSVSKEKLSQYSVDVIFINDGSTDNTSEFLQSLATHDTSVSLVTLKTNMGKSSALATGFREARGDIIVTLDGDLQDRPENIPQLITLLERGNDLVVGWKKVRQDPLEKVLLSKLFNACVRHTWNIPLHDANCGLKAMTRATARTLKDITGDSHRFIPVLAKKAGYSQITEIPITHDKRKYGISKYGLSRIFDGFTSYISLLLLGTITKDAQTAVTVSMIGVAMVLIFVVLP